MHVYSRVNFKSCQVLLYFIQENVGDIHGGGKVEGKRQEKEK